MKMKFDQIIVINYKITVMLKWLLGQQLRDDVKIGLELLPTILPESWLSDVINDELGLVCEKFTKEAWTKLITLGIIGWLDLVMKSKSLTV